MEERLAGKRLFLSFQGVESAFYVWLNGVFIGYSEDSFTPSEFEITEAVREGENRLAVEVYKRCSGSWLEDQDFWRFSGIFREVYLYAIPEIHVRDLRVVADTDDTYTEGRLSVFCELTGSKMLSGVTVLAKLFDPEGREVLRSEYIKTDFSCTDLTEGRKKEEAPSGQVSGEAPSGQMSGEAPAAQMSWKARLPQAKLWSGEEPTLYTLELFCPARRRAGGNRAGADWFSPV